MNNEILFLRDLKTCITTVSHNLEAHHWCLSRASANEVFVKNTEIH